MILALGALLLGACNSESRTQGPDLPQTPPTGAQDPRASKYEGNRLQVSQGGRYFTWYGCGDCHGGEAKGPLDLADGQWIHGDTVDQVYAFIANGHPGALAGYGARIPVEQLWQITAYVRTLEKIAPEKRRRQDVDQTGEARGDKWSGPVK